MKKERIRKVIGQKVKHCRKNHSLMQTQLTAEMGAVSSYITSIEVGKEEINLKKIVERCEYFNITVSDLLSLRIKSENEYIIKNIAGYLSTWKTEQIKQLETMVTASNQAVTKL